MSELLFCKSFFTLNNSELERCIDFKSQLLNCNDIPHFVHCQNNESAYYFKHFDCICTESQEMMYSGKTFEQTPVYKILNELISVCTEIYLWYAGYFEDIPAYCNSDDFLETVKNSVLDSSCEIYCSWKKL